MYLFITLVNVTILRKRPKRERRLYLKRRTCNSVILICRFKRLLLLANLTVFMRSTKCVWAGCATFIMLCIQQLCVAMTVHPDFSIHGFADFGGTQLFSVYHKPTQKSEWLELPAVCHGLNLIDYDAARDAVIATQNDREFVIWNASGSGSGSGGGLDLSSTHTLENTQDVADHPRSSNNPRLMSKRGRTAALPMQNEKLGSGSELTKLSQKSTAGLSSNPAQSTENALTVEDLKITEGAVEVMASQTLHYNPRILTVLD